MSTRVLLVEDDPAYARLVRECLADSHDPHHIVAKDTLADAIIELERELTDVVLLDLGLPDAQGLDTLEQLRRSAPRVPVVVLSGQDDLETALAAMRLGAQEYLVKGRAEHVLLPRALRYAMERKRMTDFEQLLFGVVGHDLRGPLQVVSLASEIIERDAALSAGSKEALARLDRAVRRANALVHDLLDLTRLRLGGRLPLDPRDVDLRSIVDAIVREIEATEPGRRIAVQHEGVAEGCWDRDRIEQVVANLLGNALQHSPRDTPITIEVTGGTDTVELAIHNLGPPIPADLLPRLFEPLTRAQTRRQGPSSSVGLGLFIVEQIVQAHGGRIDVRSDAEHGTRFTVTLPRVAVLASTSMPT